MTAPRVCGIDPSLTATGVADDEGCTTTWAPKRRGVERLAWFRKQVDDTVVPWADLVAIEGYSMGTARQQSHAHALGELGGVIRLALYDAGVPYVEIAPATLKKFACGVGNAKKSAVLTAAVRRLGYGGDSEDEADALWLRAAALDAYGYPVVQMPAAHRAALAAVQWPALGEAGAA